MMDYEAIVAQVLAPHMAKASFTSVGNSADLQGLSHIGITRTAPPGRSVPVRGYTLVKMVANPNLACYQARLSRAARQARQ
jgi:hypothetical protein